MELKMIPINEIRPNPFQPRETFEKESLRELADSIKDAKIIQPIVVRELGPNYQIIAGERRWRAAQIAGLREILCIVREVAEERVLFESLIENLHRKNLTDTERENAIHEILYNRDDFGIKTKAELARRLGIREHKVSEDIEAWEFRHKEEIPMGTSTDVIRRTRGLESETRKRIIEKVEEGEIKASEVDTVAKVIRRASRARALVEGARQRDVGRGIARIDQKTMRALGISAGDVIEIIGKGHTTAIAWPAYSEDQNEELIRIDDFAQRNAGVMPDELVEVQPVHVSNAVRITIAPTNMKAKLDVESTKNSLRERCLLKGDITCVKDKSGRIFPLIVLETIPDGAVRIKKDTDLRIREEPATIREIPYHARLGPEDKRARAKVLDNIRSNIRFEFPITESDFSPQHRKKITDLVSILQKYDATLGKEHAKAQEVARARSIWSKMLGRKSWRDLESEREMLAREAEEIGGDYETKVEEMAVSIKEYVLSAAHTQIDFGRLLRVFKKRGIILETIECPNCLGILKISEVPKKEEVLQCRYCGKSILAINLFEKFKEILGL